LTIKLLSSSTKTEEHADTSDCQFELAREAKQGTAGKLAEAEKDKSDGVGKPLLSVDEIVQQITMMMENSNALCVQRLHSVT